MPPLDRLTRLAAAGLAAPAARVLLASPDGPRVAASFGDAPLCGCDPGTGREMLERASEAGRTVLSDGDGGEGTAWAAAPFLGPGGGTRGILWVCGPAPRAWSADQVRMLEALAEEAGRALGADGGAHLAGETEDFVRDREQTERFRLLFEESRDAIYRTDLEGRLLEVNGACCEMLRFAREDAWRFRASDFYADPATRAEFLGILEARGAVRDFETRLRRTDGTEFLAQLSGSVLQDSEGNWVALQGVIRDITERRALETSLRESRERFRTIFEQTPHGIFVLDQEGRFTAMNPTMASHAGYEAEEVVGTRYWELMVEEDRPLAATIFERLLAGEPREFEFRIRHRDGHAVDVRGTSAPLYRDGAFVGIFGTSADITAEKRAQEDLRRSEERFRLLFEEDLTANFVATPDGALVACNRAFARLFGFASPEEVLRHQEPAEMRTLEREVHKRLLREGQLEAEEMELSRVDGSAIQVLCTAYAIIDGAGEPAEIRGHLLDITERKALEAQLLHAQKLEGIGRLAGGIAHDFNNLLTAILGNASMLLEDLPADSPFREDVEEIQQSGERARSLTRQLLAFSRKQVLHPEIMELGATARASRELLRRILGEDVELLIDTGDAPYRVRADPGQMEQVLLNLAVNARDAMPGGGRLAIRTDVIRVGDEEAARRSEAMSPGPYVRLTVTDDGEGMSPEVRERAFEPFFTTKELGEGTGLGLSTVYGIVAQSGGVVEIQSRLGEATTFTILLPPVEAEAGAGHGETQGVSESEEAPEPHDEPPANRRTILLVEDEPSVRRLARRALERVGYTVLEADRPEAALELLPGYDVDLLLTDVVMPGRSGPELADEIRRLRPDLPVIFMSGYLEGDVLRRGVEQAESRFLRKPFGPRELLDEVRACLEEREPG